MWHTSSSSHIQTFSRIVGANSGASPPVVVGMKQRNPQSTRSPTRLVAGGHFCRSLLCRAMEGQTTLTAASPPSSGMGSPVPSPVASLAVLLEAAQSRTATAFAGVACCRHSYATSNSKHPQGGLRLALYPIPIYVPCTRRLRYRHRAGSTAPLHHLGDRNRLGAGNSNSTADHRLGAALAAPRR